ncbi:TPA: hypothetical protein EYO12_02500 [Candidatus Saccharibacteria bacterium]|nr:hypothetical protein [Candidatus Saccharibacteria bacterium]HIO87628.1 hypothetical protein [Candidatus Saccharibacteria bacterium]
MKDVIYLDIEDDITSAISKFKKSKSKIVALVPPKRSSMLASVVNLKLLKKASETNKKQLVLITTDETLRNLAGGLGVYVAKNLTTQPEVPATTNSVDLPSDVIEASEVEVSKEVIQEKTVSTSEKASTAAPKKTAKNRATDQQDDEEVEQIDEADTETTEKLSLKEKFKKLKPIKKEKQLPNFEQFRKRVILGLLAIVLIFGGGAWAVNNVPEAQVSLRGQTSSIILDEEVRFSTSVSEIDLTSNIIPAQRKSVEATQEVSAPTTGEKNIGEQATGEITIENCMQSNSFTLSAGTRIQHSSGLIYKTTKKVTVPGGDFDVVFFSATCDEPGTASVEVIAEQAGDNYNIAGTSSNDFDGDPYTIVNFSTDQNDNLLINGDAMSGGTNDIIRTVTEDDIQTARDKLTDDDISELTNELSTQFEGDVVLLEKTISTDNENDVVSHNPGDEADNVTIKRTAVYSVYAVERSVYEEFLSNKVTVKLSEQQTVVDTGIDSVIYALLDVSTEVASMQIKVTATAGPNIDIPSLQEQLKGLGYTEAISYAEGLDGILKAEIELSPFWASGMPKRADKINIAIEIVGLEDDQTDTDEAEQDESSSDAETENPTE